MAFALTNISKEDILQPLSSAFGCPVPTAFIHIAVQGAASFTSLQEERIAHECSDTYVHPTSNMKGSSFKPYMMRHTEAYLPFHLNLTEAKVNREDNNNFNSRANSISALVMGTLARIEDNVGNPTSGNVISIDEDRDDMETHLEEHPGNGSVHFLFWFLDFNDIPEAAFEVTLGLIQLDTTVMMSELVSFARLIWASFVRGQCHWTIKLIEALLSRMRRELTFTADEEREFSSVLRFLIDIIPLRQGSLSQQMFLRWQSQAFRSVEDARSVFAPREEDDPRILLIKCDIFMKILLVCSGDARCLMEIESIKFDSMDIMCGICSVIRPFMSMRELQEQIRIVFGNVDSNWYNAAVLGLFTSTTFFDVVSVMELISNALSLMLRQANSIAISSGSVDLDNVQYDERMEALSLLYITAHTADICAPAFAAGKSKRNRAINTLHQRNNIMREYILAIIPDTSFIRRRSLLDAALSYIAWSPIIDVEVLPRALASSLVYDSPCVEVAVGDLVTLCQTMFSSRSALHQPRLRNVVSKKLENDAVLGQLWSFQDNFCDLALRNAITNLIKHRLYVTKEYSVALTELAHYQKTLGPRMCDDASLLFKDELKKVLNAHRGCDMLASHIVIQIGECVNTGAVKVKDSFDDIEMRKLVRVCSCVAEIMVLGGPLASHFMEDFTENNTKHMYTSAGLQTSVIGPVAKFPIITTYPTHHTSPANAIAAILRGGTRLIDHCIEFMNDDVKLAVVSLMGASFEICAIYPDIAKVALSDLNALYFVNGLAPFISFKQKASVLMTECSALTNYLHTKAPNDTIEETRAKMALLFRVVNKDVYERCGSN